MGSRMLRPWTLSTLAILALALPLGAAARPGASRPAPFAGVTQFQLPHPDSRPYTIVTGPNGNLWFTESSRGVIGQIMPRGWIKEYQLPDPGSGPYGITVGADGNLWFTERYVDRIGKITPDGVITEYGGLTENAQPWDITALPDGTFWFTEENVDQVGRIDQSGQVIEYPTGPGTLPTFITTAPNGDV